ncbi:MAG: IPT/TIG domain-containing protein [Cyclobacteriaceae bacterium]|nr:IPT/TIG domain-containing protein [Cyclobacteriaceae bacterium]
MNITLKRCLSIYNLIPALVAGLLVSCGNNDPEPKAATPIISSITPDAGAAGMEVTIVGMNFSNNLSNNKVYFNGVEAMVTAATADNLVAIVPGNASPGPISVKVKNSDNAISPESFRYYDIALALEALVDGKNQVKLWRNNVVDDITDGSVSISCTSIAISGTDTYITGNTSNGPVYWKNKELNELSPGITGATHAIAIHEGDIYVAGNSGSNSYAAYWKNGALTYLNEEADGYASNIAFAGPDVYFSGSVSDGSKYVPRYWKNGIENPLAIDDEAFAEDIKTNGDDVYVLAFAVGSAPIFSIKYWKNGVIKNVSGSNQAQAYSMDIAGTDIYVAGYEKISGTFFPRFWKNEVVQEGPFNAGTPGFIRKIVVINEDIIMTGYLNIENHLIPFYSVNNTLQTLNDQPDTNVKGMAISQ